MIEQIHELEEVIKKYPGFSQAHLTKIYSEKPLAYWENLVDYSNELHWSNPKHVTLYTELYVEQRCEEDSVLDHLMVENGCV